MTKAKPFLQHSTSCTIWLGPKATGGGFNDRADVQHTCRGMWGDGLKKTLIKSLAWKGCTRSAVRRGQGEGARHMSTTKGRWPHLNFVCGKYKSAHFRIFYHPVSFKTLLFIWYFCIQMSTTELTCLAINNNIFPQIHEVYSIGISPKYSDREIQFSWQICTAASVGCRDE